MVASDFSRGNKLLRSNKLEEAVTAYRSAIAQNPDFYLAHHNLGEALEQLGRWEEAIVAYGRSVELKPEVAWSHLNLSRVLRQVGQVEEAEKAGERAVEVEPKLAAGVTKHSANSIRTQDTAKIQVTAERQADNVVENSNNCSYSLNECFEIVELEPQNSKAYLKLGNAFLQLKKLEQSIIFYKIALQLNSNDAEANYQLGKALEMSDRTEDAMSFYRKAVDFNLQQEEHHVQSPKSA